MLGYLLALSEKAQTNAQYRHEERCNQVTASAHGEEQGLKLRARSGNSSAYEIDIFPHP